MKQAGFSVLVFFGNRTAARRTIRRALRVMGAAALAVAGACARPPAPSSVPAELVIEDARVLDVRTGRVDAGRTVVVRGGMIDEVLNTPRAPSVAARRRLRAEGRLLTPGLVDAHGHTVMLFPPGTRLRMDPDSIAAYRRAFAAQYLPWGVTAVRDAGSSEEVLPMLLAWARPSPQAPDFYPSGGALVTAEAGRTPYAGHAVVNDPADAARKVREYHAMGIRSIKLYWRLREPELRAAFQAARALGMQATAHVDNGVVTVDQALDVGVRQFEHAHTLAVSVLTQEDLQVVGPRVYALQAGRRNGAFFISIPEYWNYLGADNAALAALVHRLAAEHAALTPTLHLYAQRMGLATFTSPPWSAEEDTEGFSAEQLAAARAGYGVMAQWVRRMHEAGVTLRVGTDTRDPGRAVLSEMLELHRAGIPMADVFRIATLNGAAAVGDTGSGAVEPGMRANLVLFDQDPLVSPQALFGGRTVVKDGAVWNGGP